MRDYSLLAILLSIPLLGCDADDPAVGETTDAVSTGTFFIRALGNRCIDLGAPIKGNLGAPLVIMECAKQPSQQFLVQEIDLATHDFNLVTSSGLCVGVAGPVTVGAGLQTQSCNGSSAQRFAFDGDALLVGIQANGARVSRDFVIEPLGANTNQGTRVVVGTRELSDNEYWRMLAVDGSATRPTTGFVTVTSEAELRQALNRGWGTVIELELPNDTMELTQLWEADVQSNVVRAGVTLRGNRKFLFNGAELGLSLNRLRLLAPPKRPDDNWLLGVEDQARITGLRLRGPSRSERVTYPDGSQDPAGSGILIQRNSGDPLKRVIVDHVDASDWTGAAIGVAGAHARVPGFDAMRCLTEDENQLYHTAPIAHVVGNFIHHNSRYYGVVVGAGGYAYTARNLFFLSGHEVTADFNASNRYFVHDSLFTSENDNRNQELDVHGACGELKSHWTGGRAGDLFDIGWNTFLSDRTIMMVRGTPCHYASFHDNVAVGDGTLDTGDLKVDTSVDPSDTLCVPVPPKPHNQIMIINYASNQFGITDPTRAQTYGDFGKGDFDGDGVEDLFLGTGATWWFSSGGKAEWRFLNRMPERASALRFGDFDADGRTDVIAVHGDRIDVSWGGGSPWYLLTGSPFQITDLAVGQFDNDKRADLFAANGSTWSYASAGTTWNFFATSDYRTSSLRFGDFTGDGKTDVFGIVGGAWQIVRGPNQMWEYLGPARSTSIKQLFVADFDGNGYADVARNEPQSGGSLAWVVSKDGTDSFRRLRYAPATQPLGGLPLGNYDDKPGADVLVWDDIHLSLASGGRTLGGWSRQSMR